MTKITKISFLFMLLTLNVIAQKKKKTAETKATFSDYQDLKKKTDSLGINELYYIDSTYNYKVIVPKWLKLIETKSDFAWGGTLPAVAKIENAILIKSFQKSKFKSLKEFREYIIEDLSFGQYPPWSKIHQFVGKNELEDFKQIGKSYRVFMRNNNLIYHCCYVLCETKTAYLWIDFTATPETYEKNFGKFKEFIAGLEPIH